MTIKRNNGSFTFLETGEARLSEAPGNCAREPWLMLMARRNQKPLETLCWGLTNSGASFARIGTQEGDLLNGFVHEDPYKTRLLGPYLWIAEDGQQPFTNRWYPLLRDDQKLTTTYGFGFLESETSCNGIDVTTEAFISESFDGMLQIASFSNASDRTRTLRIYNTNPVNIGDARDIQFAGFNTLMMGGGRFDADRDALVWRCHYGIPFTDDPDALNGMFGKVLVHTTSEGCASWSTRYEDFYGQYAAASAGKTPAGLDEQRLAERDCEDLSSSLSTVMIELTLRPGETKKAVFSLIAASTEDYYARGGKKLGEALEIVRSPEKAEQELAAVKKAWEDEMALLALGIPGEQTLCSSFKWLQYQCAMVAALNRMKSRFHSGFEYGYGFRDILQDLGALLPYNPERVRDMILYVSTQMFSDGTVYHNFFASAPGNRDFAACDDPLWLVFAVCDYIRETGDSEILKETVAYADEKEGMAPAQGTVLGRLHAALDRVWGQSSEGLPVMFDADWNDDLGSYPEHYSTMTAQMLFKALLDAAELLDFIGESPAKAAEYRDKAERTKKSVRERCIDRDGRYIRLLSPDPASVPHLGSAEGDGLVFFEPVAWAGYSGIATREEFETASRIAERELADSSGYIICRASTDLAQGKLPADKAPWKRNAPGKKENGGAFKHLESWYIASLCAFGYGKRAADIYRRTLPAVCSEADPWNYAAERFVYPEYVSGPDSNEHGRAGHTWLTGTAPTRHRVLVESMLGLQPSFSGLNVAPCVDPSWKEFFIVRAYRGTKFSFRFENPKGLEKGTIRLAIDGKEIDGSLIPSEYYDKGTHSVRAIME